MGVNWQDISPLEQLQEAKDCYRKNASTAFFFDRFIILLGIFAGSLANLARMLYQQFLLGNLGGAAVWATTMYQSGFLFRESRFFRTNRGLDSTDRYCCLALSYYVVACHDMGIWAEDNKNNF